MFYVRIPIDIILQVFFLKISLLRDGWKRAADSSQILFKYIHCYICVFLNKVFCISRLHFVFLESICRRGGEILSELPTPLDWRGGGGREAELE